MNLNLFDDVEDLILHERENSLVSQDTFEKNNHSADVSDNDFQMSRFPKHTPLAMAYVPFQQWGEVYSEDDALCKGTLFPDLKFPFEGGCDDE